MVSVRFTRLHGIAMLERIGDATAPVGGGRGIDGVLSLYLKENANKIDET